MLRPHTRRSTRRLARFEMTLPNDGDPHRMSLWAGQGYQRVEARPAGEIVDVSPRL